MAIGLKLGKPVYVLPGGQQVAGAQQAETPVEAVRLAFERIGG